MAIKFSEAIRRISLSKFKRKGTLEDDAMRYCNQFQWDMRIKEYIKLRLAFNECITVHTLTDGVVHKIKNIQELKNGHFSLRRLYIESSELEDVSDIVSLENILTIDFVGSEKLKYFPDITNLNKLRSVCLRGCKNINFNELAEKLPSGIQIIDLSHCGIESFFDIANLLKKNITRFDLSFNLIKEINFDMEYGSATYIYMTGCPVGDNYFKWNEPASEEYPGYVKNLNNVIFAFGYMEDYAWVIEE